MKWRPASGRPYFPLFWSRSWKAFQPICRAQAGAPKYGRSLRKQEHNPRKIHLIDPALTHALRVHPDEDIGHKLENIVFLHERRRSSRQYYYANSHELDVIAETPEALRVVNVCWNLGDSETLRRESAAAIHAGNHNAARILFRPVNV